MSSSLLREHFCVVGLNSSLVTGQGEQGWLGSEHRYKPHLLDSLPYDGSSRVPPELPTVSTSSTRAVRYTTHSSHSIFQLLEVSHQIPSWFSIITHATASLSPRLLCWWPVDAVLPASWGGHCALHWCVWRGTFNNSSVRIHTNR